ncbi:Sigma-70 region 2 [Streptomyces sp. Ncost-T10-10d]|nr:Sigma-70 region 2 [Streptomyces sp. Ncost-T10-10d]
MRTRVRAGEPSAFAELFDSCARTVHNHAFRLTADWATAQDVMAPTFMEAWRLRDRIDPEGGSFWRAVIHDRGSGPGRMVAQPVSDIGHTAFRDSGHWLVDAASTAWCRLSVLAQICACAFRRHAVRSPLRPARRARKDF